MAILQATQAWARVLHTDHFVGFFKHPAEVEREMMARTPYTPPPAVAAWLKTQADKPKGRDYEALTRAALRKPVGYWEDAPRGLQFVKSGVKIEVHPAGCECPACYTVPAPQCGDGAWPRWEMSTRCPLLWRYDGPRAGDGEMFEGGGKRQRATSAFQDFPDGPYRVLSKSEAAQWLTENGHAEVAASLRAKGADDLYEPAMTPLVVGDRVVSLVYVGAPRTIASVDAFGVGRDQEGFWWGPGTGWENVRILKRPQAKTPPRDDLATGRVSTNSTLRRVLLGGVMYGKQPSTQWYSYSLPEEPEELLSFRFIELFGPEKDAILAECAAAMKLEGK